MGWQSCKHSHGLIATSATSGFSIAHATPLYWRFNPHLIIPSSQCNRELRIIGCWPNDWALRSQSFTVTLYFVNLLQKSDDGKLRGHFSSPPESFTCTWCSNASFQSKSPQKTGSWVVSDKRVPWKFCSIVPSVDINSLFMKINPWRQKIPVHNKGVHIYYHYINYFLTIHIYCIIIFMNLFKKHRITRKHELRLMVSFCLKWNTHNFMNLYWRFWRHDSKTLCGEWGGDLDEGGLNMLLTVISQHLRIMRLEHKFYSQWLAWIS